jgi:tetratricopeptide (TPR) repeat protein
MNTGRTTAPASRALLIIFFAFAPARLFAIEEPPIKDLPNRITAVQTLNEQIAQAAERITKQDWKAALRLLKAIIDSPAFEDLSVDQRHALLSSTSGVALELKDHMLSQSYSKRASVMPNATPDDWQVRFYASFGLADMTDAAVALSQIAKQTPTALADIKDPSVIFRILNELKKSPAPQYFDLLEAIYGANWKIDGLFEPYSVWRDYAVALLERARKADAKHVASRIKQPSSLISIRVDKRFDSIVKSNPELFDIDKAVETDIANLRKIVLKSPRNLQCVVELTYALLKAHRYDEVLSLTDEIIQKEKDSRNGEVAYDDINDNLIWILNNRAIALGGLGRRDEELELLIRAARRPEHGDPNVSQAINLGGFYCDLGRPKDALFAILDVEKTSPYGRSQVETVHLCAALQLGDKDAAVSALNYLKEHQADSPRTYQSALVLVGDYDGAAALLIQRLNDPPMRADALTEVQNYRDPADLEWPVKSRERFRVVVNRDDVQKAIHKVGRIESFNLRSDMT